MEVVQSGEEVSQELLLVDLAHLIPWHLVHQHQACGDGVGRHVFPATDAGVNTLTMAVLLQKHTQTQLIRACTGTRSTLTDAHMYALTCATTKRKHQNKNKPTTTTTAKQRRALWQSSRDKERNVLHTLGSSPP